MLSRLSYFTCTAVMLYLSFVFHPKWQYSGSNAVISWDVSGYYWYLPSAFIYKDLKYQRFADTVLAKHKPTDIIMQFARRDDGACVLTYSAGMAIMYLPFFTVAHILAPVTGYNADGFSPPYQLALQIGSLFVALIGLWYFRKLMQQFYTDKVVAAILFVLAIGTNYLNYASIDAAQTHNWLFTIYVFLLLATINFYTKPSVKYAIAIGMFCGFAILIRPSEMISVLIPMLWGMETISATEIKKKLHFLKHNSKHIAIATICIIIIGSIQLIYWKYVSGHWLVYSYGEDKTFSWLRPHLLSYNFSYKSGWFMYTPMMLLAFAGIIPFIKHGSNKVAILCFIFLNWYIVCAWDVWWFGGRAMIQSYALMMFPMAALVNHMFEKKWLQWIVIPCLLIGAYVNIWFTIQSHKSNGLYEPQGMTAAYYKRVIGRWHVNDDIQKLKDTDELFEGNPKNMKLIYSNSFENDTNIHSSYPPIEGNVSDYIAGGMTYSRYNKFAYNSHQYKWLRVQASFTSQYKEWTEWKMPQLTVRFTTKEDKQVKVNSLRVWRYIDEGTTGDVYIDVKVPAAGFDSVNVFLWNPGTDKTLVMDNLKVWSFNE